MWLPCFKLMPKHNLSSLIIRELESTKIMKALWQEMINHHAPPRNLLIPPLGKRYVLFSMKYTFY